MMATSNRRTSLPAIIHTSRGSHTNPNSLLPRLGFLKELSEFDIDPPFLSPASSSSSENSPMLLSPTMRPASARLYRKQRKLSPSNEKNFSLFNSAMTDKSSSYDSRDEIDESIDLENENNNFYKNFLNSKTVNEDVYFDYEQEQKLNDNSFLKKSHNSSPISLSSKCNSPGLKKRLNNKRLKEIANKNCGFSYSIESSRSLKNFNNNIIENENISEENSNNFDVLNDSNYNNNIEVQNLRSLLKAKNEKNATTKPNQLMRNFTVDASGRIINSTVSSTESGGKIFKPPASRSNKNRRATCPEIWLSTVEDERREVTKCVLAIFGHSTVGKKSVAQQLFGCADANPASDLTIITSEELQRESRTVPFIMNESEIQLEITLGSKIKTESILATNESQGILTDNVFTIYVIVYSVDNRESFTHAAKLLYKLYEHRAKSSIPLILVANKIDLQRKRRVSSMEGKMLSKIYKSSFVEISALLSMNIDGLLRETLKKIQKNKLQNVKAHERGLIIANVCNNDKTRRNSSRRFVGQIIHNTHRFAKSCEELVARIIAL